MEKFIGDEVMAVFGVPVVHEDDALRAVRSASAMRERLASLNDELEEAYGIRLAVRIGVNTGEVVVGDPSTGGVRHGRAGEYGEAPRAGGRPGADPDRQDDLPAGRERRAGGPLESFPVKGKRKRSRRSASSDVDAGAPGVARRHDTPLVGRTPELAALAARVRAAAAGPTSRLVTVSARPGSARPA